MSDNPNILIIDDDRDLLETLTLYLQSKGFGVKSALNGEEALKIVQSFKPDLIVLDFIMPKLDGSETYNRIKKLYNNTIPFIFITGTKLSLILDKNERGFIRNIRKPFEFANLYETIVELLKLSHNSNEKK